MTDFFAALADRAREAPLVVRPRLPSRFEEAAPGSTGPLDAETENAVFDEIAPHAAERALPQRSAADRETLASEEFRSAPSPGAEAAAPPRARAVKPTPPVALDETPAVPDRRAHPPAPPSAEPVLAPQSRPTAVRAAEVKPALAAALESAAARAEPPTPRPIAAETGAVDLRATGPEPPAKRPLSPVLTEVGAPDVAARGHMHDGFVEPRVRRSSDPATVSEPPRGAAEVAPRNGDLQPKPTGPRGDRDAQPAVPAVAVRARAVAAPAPPLPASVARAAAAIAAPLRALAQTAETTVHVTIGRIEVRAVAERAERRSESKPSPVISLGDYLHSRSARR